MMRIKMRTTVSIDEATLRAAKKEAAELGISLSQLVSRALRDIVMERGRQPRSEFRMVTFGEGEPAIEVSPARLRDEIDRSDVARFRAEE